MKITEQWLEEGHACTEGVKWFKRQNKQEAVEVLNALIADDKLDWANWTIVRVMKREKHLAYAIFAAEQVIEIYEKKYPNDNRPRKAIEAAKAVLKNPSKKNKAAYAAHDAADAAHDAADAAAYAAHDAAHAAHDAAARKEMRLRILNYGVSLLTDHGV